MGLSLGLFSRTAPTVLSDTTLRFSHSLATQPHLAPLSAFKSGSDFARLEHLANQRNRHPILASSNRYLGANLWEQGTRRIVVSKYEESLSDEEAGTLGCVYEGREARR